MKGHIRERSPGHWAIILDVRDAAGKRRRRWHSFAGTKRQAQVECARIISEMKAQTYVDPSKQTAGAFLTGEWLPAIKMQVAPRTYERYSEIVRVNLVPSIGSEPLLRLTPAQITAAYAKALESGRKDGRGLSPRSVHHMHRVLRQALATAVKWRKIVRNPADDVDPPKVERKTVATYDTPTAAGLIDATRETRLFVPVLLAITCGLRRGEIAALRWGAVNLDGGQLSVRQSVEQMNNGVRLKEPKSGHARTVALPASVVTELRAHRVRQAQELLRLGVRLSDDSFVAAHADGSMMQPTWITHEWVRLVKGLPQFARLTFHSLRHSHATALLSAGVHPKVASERLGHSSIAITIDLYSHVIPGMQEAAAAALDEAFDAARKKANGSNRGSKTGGEQG